MNLKKADIMRTILALVLLLLSASNGTAETSVDIQGAWVLAYWTLEDGTIVTPDAAGYTVQIQFDGDGVYKRYHDLSLVNESTWHISYVWIYWYGALVHVEFIDTGYGDVWEPREIIPGDTMNLNVGFGAEGHLETYYFMGTASDKSASWGELKLMFRD